MRTKMLLLTAALAAAGIASSLAQSVYSVNAVGYVNVTCTPGFTMIQNPMSTTNNSVTALFVNCPEGANLLTWNQSFRTFDYNNYSGGSWDPSPDATLAPGQGVLFQNPTLTPYVVTFVGEVLQGTNLLVTMTPGFNMVGSKVPQAGFIQTDLSFAPDEGDNVLKWNQTFRTYDYWNYSGGSWDPAEPTLQPGEACFVQKLVGGNMTWTRSFTIN